ncbi:MAG: hypothetical protein NTV86_22220, partial [Planctomycetota bacterium]|nr:hypothetical protein [Planctomycetota bacterium]
RADADARLTVRVSALRTSEAVTVSAMSARWPDVAVGLGMFLQEQVDAAGALHAPDGTCRVSVALKMDALAAKLRQLIPEAKDKDQPAEAPDGAMMARLNGADAVTVDGLARVSEALLPPPLLPTPRGAANASLAQASNAVGAFWASNATLRGQKLAELLAARRARERLQVVLEELPLRTDMRVRDVLGSAGGPIRKEMATFVKAAAEAGRRYHPNVLLVEVEVAVPVDSFHQALLGWLKLHAPASRLFQRAAEEAIRDRRGDVASACGMAAVPAKHLAGQASGFLGKATQIAGDLPNWLNDTAQAQGAAPAANDPKLVLAAARRDAAAKLNETVLALMVPGRTTLRDFAAGDKEFLASLTALCQVAEPVANLKPFGPDGSARVTVALELEPVWRLMLHHHLKQAPKPDWETGAP